MSMKRKMRAGAGATIVILLALVADAGLDDGLLTRSFVGEAYAKVGRPLTPGSVAGDVRRTTRRVVRRSTIYINALPAACVKLAFDNVVTWQCGADYYQAYGTRYVVVYVQ
jgi:hypothetical protein